MKWILVPSLVAATLLFLPAPTPAENYVGILLDGYQKDCIVQSGSERYDCSENRNLYPGDKIFVKPGTGRLKVKWAPYAAGKELDPTTLLVVFQPPQDKTGLLQNLAQHLGFLKTRHGVSTGVTRSGSTTYKFTQPSDNATLFPKGSVDFVWGGVGNHLVIREDGGKEIFRESIRGKASLRVDPSEIGMTHPKVYTWTIEGKVPGRTTRIRILNDDIARQVSADLGRIDREDTPDREKSIRKAAYLQFISDAYPRDVDLYWLSLVVLKNMRSDPPLTEDEKTLVEEIRRNAERHSTETM